MTDLDKPVANASLVFREEFDHWAVLFEPDTGEAFGIPPTGVFIWNHLDGEHTGADILGKMVKEFKDIPDDAEQQIGQFLDDLLERGFAGHVTEAS